MVLQRRFLLQVRAGINRSYGAIGYDDMRDLLIRFIRPR